MGSGTSKVPKDPALEARRQELLEWSGKTFFYLLPEPGLDEFEKFLSPEDKKRLRFWRDPTVSIDPEHFGSYILDGEDMIKDADMDEEKKVDLISKAGEIFKEVNEMKEKMKPDLESRFRKFKEEKRKELSNLPR